MVSSEEQVVEEQEDETARGMDDAPLKVEVHRRDCMEGVTRLGSWNSRLDRPCKL